MRNKPSPGKPTRVRGQRPPPVAVVTGAGRGIGRGTAEAFAAEGYQVVLAELRPTLGRRTERALARRGMKTFFLPTDVADPASVTRTAQAVLRRFGRVDCLVNNAGVLHTGPLANLKVRDLNRMLAVNLRGPLLMTRALIPSMLKHGSGSVINVASLLGKMGAADYVTYCASKFGLVGFTEALGVELANTGIRVWAICPGPVDTPMAQRAGVSAADRAGVLKAEQVARVIVELATGRRRAPTGTAIEVA